MEIKKKPTTREEIKQRKEEIMRQCYECYADNGLHGTGIRSLAEYCGCTAANLYAYFENIDDIIIQSTDFCMSRVEDEFMAKAPQSLDELESFIDEIPYWTARKHGKKYRLMYQVYTHPKYLEHGKEFFKGVGERYTEYARRLEGKIGIPYQRLTSLIFILIRACVHYALFEDEFYLKSQTEALKESIGMLVLKYNETAHSGALLAEG